VGCEVLIALKFSIKKVCTPFWGTHFFCFSNSRTRCFEFEFNTCIWI